MIQKVKKAILEKFDEHGKERVDDDVVQVDFDSLGEEFSQTRGNCDASRRCRHVRAQ
jgi:hypothetical protein